MDILLNKDLEIIDLMQPVPTSRGTYITKRLAIIEKATFSFDDIISSKGHFIKEIMDIYRYKKTDFAVSNIKDNLANIEQAKAELNNKIEELEQQKKQAYLAFKEMTTTEIKGILPLTGSHSDPQILEDEAGEHIEDGYLLTLKYEKAPLEEVEYNENGQEI